MARRLTRGVQRGAEIELTLNGESIGAFEGETLAAILTVHGVDHYFVAADGQGRAAYCNMGACYGCLVLVTRMGESEAPFWTRACLTAVQNGMVVQTGAALHESNVRHD